MPCQLNATVGEVSIFLVYFPISVLASRVKVYGVPFLVQNIFSPMCIWDPSGITSPRWRTTRRWSCVCLWNSRFGSAIYPPVVKNDVDVVVHVVDSLWNVLIKILTVFAYAPVILSRLSRYVVHTFLTPTFRRNCNNMPVMLIQVIRYCNVRSDFYDVNRVLFKDGRVLSRFLIMVAAVQWYLSPHTNPWTPKSWVNAR